jgi:hypothetical protein
MWNYDFGLTLLLLKKTHYNRDNKVRLHWFGHVQRMEGNRIPKTVLYMNLEKNKIER